MAGVTLSTLLQVEMALPSDCAHHTLIMLFQGTAALPSYACFITMDRPAVNVMACNMQGSKWRVCHVPQSSSSLFAIMYPCVQEPLEAELDELETYRNGRRLDLVYVSGQNPLSAELLQLEEEHAQLSPGSRSQIRVCPFPHGTCMRSSLLHSS